MKERQVQRKKVSYKNTIYNNQKEICAYRQHQTRPYKSTTDLILIDPIRKPTRNECRIEHQILNKQYRFISLKYSILNV